MPIGKVHDSVIGDGDAMRVAGHVVENMFGSSEWVLDCSGAVDEIVEPIDGTLATTANRWTARGHQVRTAAPSMKGC